MNILSVFGLVITGAIAAMTVRKADTAYAVAISCICGVLAVIAVLPGIGEILVTAENIVQVSGFGNESFGLILKATGTAYLAQFICELCESAGEKNLASKVELAERIYVAVLSIPLVLEIIKIAEKVLQT